MEIYLATGAADFTRANFIKYLLDKKCESEDVKVIILDVLAYAGNLGTIKNNIDNRRCFFMRGDIRDRASADRLLAEYDIGSVINFAAGSHVNRSIRDPQLFFLVNVLGTQDLMGAV